MPRLLLLLPSTTYRAEEFMEAAGRLGVDVTVASDHSSTLARGNPAGLLALDFAHPPKAAARAAQFAAEYPVDAVVGVDDGSVGAAAAIAEALGLPHNLPDAVARARDKHRMRQALQGSLPSPWFRLYDRDDPVAPIAGMVPYPCVLKPLGLSGSRGVIRANDAPAFAAAFERLRTILVSTESAETRETSRSILVESYIPGVEIALEGLLTDGELRTLCIFDKPDPLEGPFFEETLYITPSCHPDAVQHAVKAVVQAAARVLDLRHGPIHAELRVNEDGVWLIEANPRSIGGRCARALRFGTEMSLEELILRHALGMEVPSYDRERRAAGAMMLPIPGAGVLQSIIGQEAAAAVSGVREVLIVAHVGQEIVPLPEGAPYLGFVFAAGETPAAVELALREAHRCLQFVIQSS